MDFVIMTVKGRKDLTEECLRSMVRTLDLPIGFVLVDAGVGPEERFGLGVMEDVFQNKEYVYWYLHEFMVCNIPEGWNYGLRLLDYHRAVSEPDRTNVWLLNNDVTFHRRGWLSMLANRLREGHTGMAGSTAASVFGLGFASGGIWGFRWDAAMEVAEEGKVLDERLNYCCQDVDLSQRMRKAGWEFSHVPELEHREGPYLIHMESQTVSATGNERLRELRAPERRILIDKHGREDGKSGYDGTEEW